MKLCFFGIYDPSYARNRVLIEGFERLGHTIIHCRVDPRASSGLKKYLDLYRAYRDVRHQSFDQVIVAFPGHTVVWLARILFGRRIIFDAFISLYDSNVADRRSYPARSLRAYRDWFWDWSSTRLASKVLLDTDAHIDYFAKRFGAPMDRMLRVWIGADDTVFYPRELPLDKDFTVSFHGTFIPLQGLSTIIEAARILRGEEIYFRLVGSGQEYARIESLVRRHQLDRVTLLGTKPISEIPSYIARAHVSLGIFGQTEKTQRVIPNKVYEAMAMGRAIITADTPALRELLPEVQELLATPVADPVALADAIKRLRDDPELRMTLERRSKEFFQQYLKPEKIVAGLIDGLG